MLLKREFTNQLKAEALNNGMNIDIFIKNIIVNGEKRGCSGHVVNKENGVCIYVNTEGIDYISRERQVLYRFAKSITDYSSNSLKRGYNRWCTEKELAASVINLLQRKELYL